MVEYKQLEPWLFEVRDELCEQTKLLRETLAKVLEMLSKLALDYSNILIQQKQLLEKISILENELEYLERKQDDLNFRLAGVERKKGIFSQY